MVILIGMLKTSPTPTKFFCHKCCIVVYFLLPVYKEETFKMWQPFLDISTLIPCIFNYIEKP